MIIISFTSGYIKSRSLDQRLLLFLICYPKNGLIFAVSFMLTMTDKNSGDSRNYYYLDGLNNPTAFTVGLFYSLHIVHLNVSLKSFMQSGQIQ